MSNSRDEDFIGGCIGGLIGLMIVGGIIIFLVFTIGAFIAAALVIAALVMAIWVPIKVMLGRSEFKPSLATPEAVHEGLIIAPKKAGATQFLKWDKAWPNYFPYQFERDVAAMKGEAKVISDKMEDKFLDIPAGDLAVALVFKPLIVGTTWLGATFMTIIAKFAEVFQSLYAKHLAKKETKAREERNADIQCTSCYRQIDMPAYRCPNPTCDVVHYDVSPGPLGLKERICKCGATMPVGVLQASAELDAVCPWQDCGATLPAGTGTRRLVTLPVFGTVSAGKSMLIHSTAAHLQNEVPLRSLTALDESSHEFLSTASAKHSQQIAPQKTALDQKQYGYSLLAGGPNEEIEVHLIDAAGERFRGIEDSQVLPYLDYAKSFVLVIDPLSIEEVRAQITGEDANMYQASTEDPSAAYGSVVDRLLSSSIDLTGRSLAIVVSKADAVNALFPKNQIGGSNDEVRNWLLNNGADNLVRRAEIDFGSNVDYFAVDSLNPHVGNERFSPLNVLEWSAAKAGGTFGIANPSAPSATPVPAAADAGTQQSQFDDETRQILRPEENEERE